MTAAKSRSQRGAALIVVLLLISTLSFIVLAASEAMAFAAHRSINARARADAIWRAVGVEALAAAAIEAAAGETPGVMTLDEAWLERPVDAPMEGGAARIVLVDATRCVNLNALARTGEDGGYDGLPQSARMLIETLTAAGAEPGEAETLAAVIVDWIDEDSVETPRGAEDSYYTALPVPYRTAGFQLADETELLAMAEVSAEFYARARRFVCVRPTPEVPPMNVNMLRPEDAPALVGLLEGAITPGEALDIIAARPPGGYADADQFWAHPALSGKPALEGMRPRAAVTSGYIAAFAEVTVGKSVVNAALTFEVDDAGRARLVSRRWGEL